MIFHNRPSRHARRSAGRRSSLRLAAAAGASLALTAALAACGSAAKTATDTAQTGTGTAGVTNLSGNIKEFSLHYPGASSLPKKMLGSTHEIVSDGTNLWLSGMNYDTIVKLTPSGQATYYPLPKGAMPHGIAFDKQGRLWAGLEGLDEIVRLDSKGKIVQTFHIPETAQGTSVKAPADNHGLNFGPDGTTLWYTGKASGTIGKLDTKTGKFTSWATPTADSLPIYIKADGAGNMWFTELGGNNIGEVTTSGQVKEFVIPTPDSRPIAIVPAPDGKSMWFSEEATDKIGRIDSNGHITEFQVPKKALGETLAGLSFDKAGNVWTEQYMIQNQPGTDYIVKIDKSVLNATSGNLPASDFTFSKIPSTGTTLHRIIQGPGGNMWFTELHLDKVGELKTS